MTKTKTPRVEISRDSLLRGALAFWLHERGMTWKQVGQSIGIRMPSAAACGKRFERILTCFAWRMCVDGVVDKTTNRKETNG